MKPRLIAGRAALIAAALACAAPAAGQSLDSLSKFGKGLTPGQSGSAAGGSPLGSLSGDSLSLGSIENVAGVLGYCQEQGYAPSTADVVKGRLLGKIGGQEKASQDSGYLSGLGGMLQGDGGQSFSLAGLKDAAGKKICGAIADKAVSTFLGG